MEQNNIEVTSVSMKEIKGRESEREGRITSRREEKLG